MEEVEGEGGGGTSTFSSSGQEEKLQNFISCNLQL
jgi:hypothetical protein